MFNFFLTEFKKILFIIGTVQSKVKYNGDKLKKKFN